MRFVARVKEKLPMLLLVYMCIMATIAAVFSAVSLGQSDEAKAESQVALEQALATERKAQRNAIEILITRRVVCPIANLVAHVPAVQFKGETLRNFVGWIEAAQKIFRQAQRNDACGEDVIAALKRRNEINQVVLEQAIRETNR